MRLNDKDGDALFDTTQALRGTAPDRPMSFCDHRTLERQQRARLDEALKYRQILEGVLSKMQKGAHQWTLSEADYIQALEKLK